MEKQKPNLTIANPQPGAPAPATPEENRVAVDGFQQVLDMLRIADPAFRESLLKRLAARDARLALELRRDLGI
jgi:hypothetical protein